MPAHLLLRARAADRCREDLALPRPVERYGHPKSSRLASWPSAGVLL